MAPRDSFQPELSRDPAASISNKQKSSVITVFDSPFSSRQRSTVTTRSVHFANKTILEPLHAIFSLFSSFIKVNANVVQSPFVIQLIFTSGK